MDKFELMARIQKELNIDRFHMLLKDKDYSEEEYLELKEVVQTTIKKHIKLEN